MGVATKQAVAAAVTAAVGTALAFAAYGEGAFNTLLLVGAPSLLVTLFAVQVRSTARAGALRRAGWWAAAVLGGGLLLLAVTAPKFVLLPALIAAFSLALGWPLATSAACLMAVAAVRSGLSSAPRAALTWGRSSWAVLLAVVATYGYGLSHLDEGMADVKDRVCRFDPSGGAMRHGGGRSLLPLHDTSCGTDTVPAFVNPFLATLTVLLAASVAAHLTARFKARRTRGLAVRIGR
ncbi:hypothetical protein [Actinoallomurus rhizosphaericola]|uniref:hypothetical protein n=1 Tax=Actinoallomurus rhizosphaericola TaxID=2952536 RepID=UPI002091FCD2|nr:hypothetical protein [Actinoallomurus rhizosphaericola]MCO5996012.1 hypothetical protein [Actinoallomurus rhizosphaericola]